MKLDPIPSHLLLLGVAFVAVMLTWCIEQLYRLIDWLILAIPEFRRRRRLRRPMATRTRRQRVRAFSERVRRN